MFVKLKKSITLKIILVYILIISACSLVLYKLTPILLNSAPEVIEGGYIQKWGRPPYKLQILIMTLFAIIIGILSIFFIIKKVCNSNNAKLCIHAPLMIYILQNSIPTITVFLFHKIAGTPDIIASKIILIVLFFTSTSSLISLILSRILIKKIIEKQKILKIKCIKINFSLKLFGQIIPILFTSIIIVFILNYNAYFNEKANYYHEYYKNQIKYLEKDINLNLEVNNFTFKDTSVESDIFYITPDKKIVTASGKKLNNMFYFYLRDISLNKDSKFSRIYAYGNESIQGTVTKIEINGQEYNFGIKYKINTKKHFSLMLLSCIIIILLNIILLYLISVNMPNDIKYVSKKLNAISSSTNKDSLNKNIYITSYDEIGELIMAFNSVQDLVKEQFEKIEHDNKLLIEQEKLSTLGVLAGGMAHDINNPTSAIKTGIFSLDYTLKTYLKNNNKEIFENRIHEIIDTLNIAVERIFSIVNSVKSHTKNLHKNDIEEFSLNKSIDKTLILINHVLKNNNCTCKISGESNLFAKGDESKLSQVITNLLINAIEAYKDGGEIEIKLSKKDSKSLIEIIDYAGGIEEKQKDNMFKNIITTKKNGSGLGLFVSYKIITSFFNGKLWFETEAGKGTKFSILI